MKTNSSGWCYWDETPIPPLSNYGITHSYMELPDWSDFKIEVTGASQHSPLSMKTANFFTMQTVGLRNQYTDPSTRLVRGCSVAGSVTKL